MGSPPDPFPCICYCRLFTEHEPCLVEEECLGLGRRSLPGHRVSPVGAPWGHVFPEASPLARMETNSSVVF